MITELTQTSPAVLPLAELERALIDAYVTAQGHDPRQLSLAADERDRLLKAASVYASAKLAEVESRSHFVHLIHGEAG